jgi:uncharacterized protein YndB with AHSA1/START domain
MTNRLKVTAQGEREILMTRVFDAPRELVFDAWTQADLLRRWLWGPDEWPLESCESDPRVGGKLRLVWRNSDGREMGLSGVWRELVRPSRIVHTEIFDEDWTGGEALVTTVLTEQAGKTTMSQTVLYASREARDAVLKSPMEQGARLSYDRMERFMASMRAGGGAQGKA